MKTSENREMIQKNSVSEAPANERDLNIDLLKIIACFAVVGLHTLGSIGLICGFAVPVFFLSSGFLLFQRQRVPAKKTLLRLARILKIAILWNILWLTFPQVFLSSTGWSSPWVSSLFHSVINCFIQRGIWQFWYLGALAILYMILQLAYWIGKLTRSRSDSMIYLIWGILLAFGFTMQIFSIIKHYPVQRNYIQTFRVWTWTQYFMMGGILLRNKERLISAVPLNINMLLLIILSALAWIVQYLEGHFLIFDLHPEYFYDDLIIACWVFTLSLFVVRLNVSRWKRLLTELAKLTLGVYIIHPFILVWITRYFPIISAFDRVLLFVALSAASSAVSFVLWRIPIIKELITM